MILKWERKNKIRKVLINFFVVSMIFILYGCEVREKNIAYKLTYYSDSMKDMREGNDFEVLVEKLDLESGRVIESMTINNIYPIAYINNNSELICISSDDGVISIRDKNSINKIGATAAICWEYKDGLYYINEDIIYKYSNLKSEAIDKGDMRDIYHVNDQGGMLYKDNKGKLKIYKDGITSVLVDGNVNSARKCGEYIIIDALNGGDSIYSLKTKELINTNLNISKIIETDGKIFRLVTSDEEPSYMGENIEVLDLETGEIDRIAENIKQYNIIYKDGYYYYTDLENNLWYYNEVNKESSILEKDIPIITETNNGIIYEKQDSFGYINNNNIEVIANSLNRSSDYNIGINGYVYKTVDRKLNLNGKIIDENIDESNEIRHYKDYIKYIKNGRFMIYDVKKEKIYDLGKREEDTYVRIFIDDARF